MKHKCFRAVIVLSLTLALHVGIPEADIIEHDLLGLYGEYYPLQECRSVFVPYEGDTAQVQNFEVRIIGYGGGGLTECCCPRHNVSWLLDIASTIKWKGQSGYWHGAILLGYPRHDFDLSLPVDDPVLNPPDFLLPGDTLRVNLCMKPEEYWSCSILAWPLGTAYSVQLVIETKSSVPVRSTTWGAIKVLFKYD